MSKQERVVCAAVKVSIVKDGYEGSRVVKGIDYKSIHQDGLLSEITHPTYCNVFISGFITNKNRFVDPVEATEIAYNARQLSRTLREGTLLKPEDLY